MHDDQGIQILLEIHSLVKEIKTKTTLVKSVKRTMLWLENVGLLRKFLRTKENQSYNRLNLQFAYPWMQNRFSHAKGSQLTNWSIFWLMYTDNKWNLYIGHLYFILGDLVTFLYSNIYVGYGKRMLD